MNNENKFKGANLNPFAWVSDAGGPALTFAENRHHVVGMPEAGWWSSGDLPDHKMGSSLNLFSVTEGGGDFMREIFKKDDGQLNFKIAIGFGDSKYIHWAGVPKTDFYSVHGDCIKFDFEKAEHLGLTFWRGGNPSKFKWTAWQGSSEIQINEPSEAGGVYFWRVETQLEPIAELQFLINGTNCVYQMFNGQAETLEASFDAAMSLMDRLRSVCAKIAAIGPAVVPVAQAPHPLDNFWSDQESKLSRSVAENQISNDPAFNQILDDVDPFIVPLDDLLSLIEQAPDDRSKGFLIGVHQCRTQFLILAGV